MKKMTLQVPIDATIRLRAEEIALQQGFSSIQEVIRLFLTKFASKSVNISFTDTSHTISPQADLRYGSMLHDADFDQNTYSVSSVKEFNAILDEGTTP